MRKLLLVMIVGIITLSGCSTTDDAVSGEMVTYESLSGPVEIPANPQRIVTDYYVGQLLSINAPIVGGDLTYSSPAWESSLSGVTDVGQSSEMVASLEPDLIITFSEQNYQMYQSIAPTVLIPYGSYNEEELVTELGVITNHEVEANEALYLFNQEVSTLTEMVDNQENTFSIVDFSMADPYVYGNKYGRAGYILYDKMNLSCTATCETTILSQDDSYLLLTQENIQDYVGDVLIVATPNAQPVDNVMFNSDTFKASSAYQNDQVYYVDSKLFYHTDMLSMMAQIEILKEIFANESV
jgi:iron complex transport system substrate-binding protein